MSECLVCSSSSTGYHYNIRSCRACAAFFRRTIHMKLRYRCRDNGNCSITKESRFCCKFCRMKKCIDVGMVLLDDSETPPDYYLDSITPTPSSLDGFPNLDEDWFTITTIFDNHEKFVSFFKAKIIQILSGKMNPSTRPYELLICQQSALAYENHQNKWPRGMRETNSEFSEVEVKRMIIDHYKEMIYIAEYLMELDHFPSLPFIQKALIYRRFAAIFFQVNRIDVSVKLLGSQLEDGTLKMITFDGSVYDCFNSKFDMASVCNIKEEQLKELMMGTELQFDKRFVKPFKQLLPDDFEIQYLLMRSLWSVNGSEGITKETCTVADKILLQLDDEITFYYKHQKKLTNVAKRIYRLHNLLTALERMTEIRKQDTKMWKTFDIFKIDVWTMDDLTQ